MASGVGTITGCDASCSEAEWCQVYVFDTLFNWCIMYDAASSANARDMPGTDVVS